MFELIDLIDQCLSEMPVAPPNAATVVVKHAPDHGDLVRNLVGRHGGKSLNVSAADPKHAITLAKFSSTDAAKQFHRVLTLLNPSSLNARIMTHESAMAVLEGESGIFKPMALSRMTLKLSDLKHIHGSDVINHPKGGEVAVMPHDRYRQISHLIGMHASNHVGDLVRVRTPGVKVENGVPMYPWGVPVEESARFRQNGKYARIDTVGGAQIHTDVPRAFRERVQSLGGKVKFAGAGLAVVFEDVAKSEEAFTALLADGHRVIKHDIPGILFVTPKLSESAESPDSGIDLDDLIAHHIDTLPGGKADGKDPSTFDRAQLTAGVHVELEHTFDIHKALEIAMDHLSEKPDYYTTLHDSGLADEPGSDPEAFESFLARIEAAILESPNEDFTQVFKNEEEAECVASGHSKLSGIPHAVINCGDNTYIVLSQHQASERVATNPAYSVHSFFDADGDEVNDKTDHDVDERVRAMHSIGARHRERALKPVSSHRKMRMRFANRRWYARNRAKELAVNRRRVVVRRGSPPLKKLFRFMHPSRS